MSGVPEMYSDPEQLQPEAEQPQELVLLLALPASLRAIPMFVMLWCKVVPIWVWAEVWAL